MLIPDAAHGTNPASAAMAGFKAVAVKSRPDGFVDLDDLAAKLDDETAVFMITNPNTLGLFEPQIQQIAKMVHDAGGLVYLDGANMNAILGITRPGDFGADLMHFNPHKTFSGPHGGGGPGAGPIAVAQRLADVPAGADRGQGRPRLPSRLRPAEVDRPGAELLRQRRRAGADVLLHPLARAGRAAANRRGRGAERQLPALAGEGHAAGAARRPLHARVRRLGRRR